MNRARYEFDTTERYFARVMFVELLLLPSDKTEPIKLAKITLATPGKFSKKNDDVLASEQMEAALWLDPSHPLIRDSGYRLIGTEFKLPTNQPPVFFDCMFGKPNELGFQPLVKCVRAEGYSVDGLVIASKSKTGMIYTKANDTFTFRGKSFKLDRKPREFLLLLDKHWPEPITERIVRDGIEDYDDSTETALFTKHISNLRNELLNLFPDGELAIPRGEWKLIVN